MQRLRKYAATVASITGRPVPTVFATVGLRPLEVGMRVRTDGTYVKLKPLFWFIPSGEVTVRTSFVVFFQFAGQYIAKVCEGQTAPSCLSFSRAAAILHHFPVSGEHQWGAREGGMMVASGLPEGVFGFDTPTLCLSGANVELYEHYTPIPDVLCFDVLPVSGNAHTGGFKHLDSGVAKQIISLFYDTVINPMASSNNDGPVFTAQESLPIIEQSHRVW
jgi:hypothetical protein